MSGCPANFSREYVLPSCEVRRKAGAGSPAFGMGDTGLVPDSASAIGVTVVKEWGEGLGQLAHNDHRFKLRGDIALAVHQEHPGLGGQAPLCGGRDTPRWSAKSMCSRKWAVSSLPCTSMSLP